MNNSGNNASYYYSAIIYYRVRIEKQVSKGKKCMGLQSGEISHKLPRVLSQWNHTGPTQFLRQ